MDYPIYSKVLLCLQTGFPSISCGILPDIYPPTERGSNFLSFDIKTVDVTKGDHPEFYPMKLNLIYSFGTESNMYAKAVENSFIESSTINYSFMCSEKIFKLCMDVKVMMFSFIVINIFCTWWLLGNTVNENVQESLIHKAVWQSCLTASGHATIRIKL